MYAVEHAGAHGGMSLLVGSRGEALRAACRFADLDAEPLVEIRSGGDRIAATRSGRVTVIRVSPSAFAVAARAADAVRRRASHIRRLRDRGRR